MQKGDNVEYRSLARPVYNAVVTSVWPDGAFVDLAVNAGAKEPVPVRAIAWKGLGNYILNSLSSNEATHGTLLYCSEC